MKRIRSRMSTRSEGCWNLESGRQRSEEAVRRLIDCAGLDNAARMMRSQQGIRIEVYG